MPRHSRHPRRLHHAITNIMTGVVIVCLFVLLTSLMRDDWNTAMASIVTGSALLPALAYVRFLLRPRKRRPKRTSRRTRQNTRTRTRR